MNLASRIQSDLIAALKEHDSSRVLVLRGLKASLKNAQIADTGAGGELTDDVALAVLKREAKRRQESIQAFTTAGRNDLADKEKQELEILKAYLPAEMGDDELRQVVEKIIHEVGEGASFGAIMGKVMAHLQGKADGRRVQDMVKKILPS